MSAPALLSSRPPSPEEGLSLPRLLDLLGLPADPGTELPGRPDAARLRELLRIWSERAAGWGAGPQGDRRAW